MIELDKDYNTTRRLIKVNPKEIAGLVKASAEIKVKGQ